jgi:vitamin B12 transporter
MENNMSYNISKTAFAVLSVCSLSHFSLQANTSSVTNTETSQPTELLSPELITVTGSRQTLAIAQLAGSVSVLTEKQIAQSSATFVSELLTQFANVDLTVNGGIGQYAELRIRGSEANHVLVLLDGVQINDLAQGGLIDLAHLPIANIARIELLRGSQSAVWGDGAIGGVLSITTKEAANENMSQSLQLSAGQNNTYQGAYQLNGRTDNLDYRLALSHYTTDGQNISLVDGNSEADGYINTQVQFTTNYHINSEHRLSGFVRRVDYTTDYDATDFVATGLPVDADNVSEGTKNTVKTGWVFTPTNAQWQIDSAFHYHQDKVDNIENQALASASKSTEAKLVSVLQVTHDFLATDSSASTDGTINIGLEYSDIDYEQAGPVVFGDPNYSETIRKNSVFIDTVQPLSKDIWLNVSTRYTDNSEFAATTDYRFGGHWQLAPAVNLFVSRGKATKNPTFTERFGFFPTSFIGNPDLEPEESVTDEVGIGFKFQGQNKATNSLDITLFKTKLQNEINGFVFEPVSGGFTSDNINSESARQGWELSSSLHSKFGQLTLAYSYLDAREDSTNLATRELRRAVHNGSITLNTKYKNAVSTYFSARYTGSRDDVFFPPFPQPSRTIAQSAYWLVNASIQWQARPMVKVGVKGNNLFNAKYTDIVGYRGLERNVLAFIHYSW